MQIKKKTVEVISYISFDNKEFKTQYECELYEDITKGKKKKCDTCNGTGIETKDTDYGEDGRDRIWRDSTYKQVCSSCNGKKYLELKQIYV